MVPIALLSGGGGGDATAKLLIQRASGEIVVSLDDPGVNRPATTKGQRTVQLTCLDSTGRPVATGTHAWPWRDDGGVGAGRPHVHQPVAPQAVASIERCRLERTDPKIEGTLG